MSRCLLIAVLGLLVVASGASAATRLVIRGAGYGHGVGMSQWGAYGYATHGADSATILAHYYTGTSLGRLPESTTVGVLLGTGRGRVAFSGARVAGGRALDPGKTYAVVPNGVGGTLLKTSAGKTLGKTSGAVRVAPAAGGAIKLLGRSGDGLTDALYRGALDLAPSAVGLDVINTVGLEDYVRGVVAAESPSSWPAAALQAQAVAARTYAITSDAGSATDGYTQYADTRSQVYHGVAAETPSTDAAVAATRLEVVTYAGKPVTTFFFSSSGGQTEDVENSFLGSPPRPWLKSVKDPYDTAAPRHRWGPLNFSRDQAAAKLGGLLKGSFRSIDVVARGVSPRVVRADVVGSRGTTRVTGPTLRARFGLFDTWASFTTIGSHAGHTTKPAPPSPPRTGDPGTGGAQAGTARVARRVLVGSITPAPAGRWVKVQRDRGGLLGDWVTVAWTQTERGGAYRATLPGPGTYRVVYDGAGGPEVVSR